MTRCITCDAYIPPCECFDNEGLDRVCKSCQTEALLNTLNELARLQAIETRLLDIWHTTNNNYLPRDSDVRETCERALGYTPTGRKDIFGDLEGKR